MAKQINLVFTDEAFNSMHKLKNDLQSDSYSGISNLCVLILHWVVDCQRNGFTVTAVKKSKGKTITKNCPMGIK